MAKHKGGKKGVNPFAAMLKGKESKAAEEGSPEGKRGKHHGFKGKKNLKGRKK